MAERPQHHERPLPLEEFIQALSSQLDRAQTSLRLKSRSLPLTFAVKDLSIDLRAHFDVINGAVCVRSPSAGETETSVLHLAFTTITRPVIEENTVDVQAAVSGGIERQWIPTQLWYLLVLEQWLRKHPTRVNSLQTVDLMR